MRLSVLIPAYNERATIGEVLRRIHKVFTREIARKLRLRQPRWGFDPEITSQILRQGCRIYEVPISYSGVHVLTAACSVPMITRVRAIPYPEPGR